MTELPYTYRVTYTYTQPDTDAEEEAAENLPGYSDHINQLNNEIRDLEDRLEASQKVVKSLDIRLSNQMCALSRMEGDIARIRQAIGQQEMDRILGEDVQSVGDEEIRLVERRSKWVSR